MRERSFSKLLVTHSIRRVKLGNILFLAFWAFMVILFLALLGPLKNLKGTNSTRPIVRHGGGCVLPDPDTINPYDKTVTKYIKKMPSRVTCPKKTSKINSYVDADQGILILENVENFKCSYRAVMRGKDDDSVAFSYWQELTGPSLNMEYLQLEVVDVKCVTSKDKLEYQRSHVNPLRRYYKGKGRPNQLNVFILIMESLSRINFNRFLNRTAAALKTFDKTSKQYDFKGLVKHARNSFPNMVSLLTGLRAYYYEMGEYIKDDFYGPYDGLPLLWKKFEHLGYVAGLCEDLPEWTLFNGNKAKGFVNKPLSFYPRPFWVHAYADSDTTAYKTECYYDRPEIEVLFEQCRHFYEKGLYYKKPTFTFMQYIEVPHGDFNKMQYMDEHLADYFNRFRGLDNTILLFAGDHGNRYGDFVETTIGNIENSMPYARLIIPKKLVKQNPSIETNLKANEKRLVTWMDMHETLLDVLTNDYTPKEEVQEIKRAYSLWREVVPKERNCQDALIEMSYCSCGKRKPLALNATDVKLASEALVKGLNKAVESERKCCPHRLAEIITADTIEDFSANKAELIELVVRTLPSKGTFRATLAREKSGAEWALKGGIARISKYGSQADCINNREIKPYCFCSDKCS